MPQPPFERRTRRCQSRLGDGEALALFPGPNLYYLTGFHEEPRERPLLFFLTADADPVFVAPEVYAAQLREDTWVTDVRTYGDADADHPRNLVETVADDLGLAGRRMLVDPTMWARFTYLVERAVPSASFGLADEVVADLRVRKDDAELAALRRAAAVADDVARAVRELGDEAVGVEERELARRIERRLTDAGVDHSPFDVIVASGPNGARPHHRYGDRTIQAGDPVVLDFGTRVDHYPSDQTRTVVFAGDPPAGFEPAFEAVRDAQAAAVDAVEPGASAAAVDAAARDVIADRGFGDTFLHRTGHGVGLDVHEEPYVVADNHRKLEPGMVFSVEPGVYLEGQFGVRIEDLVAVTEDGCERLNDSPRGWRPDSK